MQFVKMLEKLGFASIMVDTTIRYVFYLIYSRVAEESI